MLSPDPKVRDREPSCGAKRCIRGMTVADDAARGSPHDDILPVARGYASMLGWRLERVR